MSSKVRIVGVSDVSTGYGSPQVLAFVDSLVEHYGEAEGMVIEPDQSEPPRENRLHPRLRVHRIYTAFHPHFSVGGRIEYLCRAAEMVRSLQPDVLVLYCTFTLPVLFKLRRRPSLVIYYAYEMTYPYGPLDVEINRWLDASTVDLIIYPDADRAARDMRLCGHRDVPVAILYNCVNADGHGFTYASSEARNGRILYAGTIDATRTFAEYYFRKEMKSIPVDLFGRVTGPDKETIEARLNNDLPRSVRYLGYVDGETLNTLRKTYCYSITIWNPIDDQHLYAAPNKFFEAIADGVPPITAPHPQCKMLVQRYKCGIVMDDWSFDAFFAAMKRALRIYGTASYESMVGNCREAVARELNWERQFAKVKPHLKEVKR